MITFPGTITIRLPEGVAETLVDFRRRSGIPAAELARRTLLCYLTGTPLDDVLPDPPALTDDQITALKVLLGA